MYGPRGYLLYGIHVIRLLQYTSLFLKASRYIGSPVGTLLREILSGGPTITLKIKEEQIVQMMHFVFARDESRLDKSEEAIRIGGKLSMIMALQELIKVMRGYEERIFNVNDILIRFKTLIFP